MEKESRRVELVLARQYRTLREGGVENICVRLRDEKTRGVPVTVALNFTGRKVWGILVIAQSAKRRSVQQRSVVQMHHEDRCVRRCCIDLIERWHPALGELKLCPPSDNPDPLRSRRPRRLLFQHAQSVGERRYTIPAQLKVVVEPAADRMHMRIIESRNDGAPPAVDDSRCRLATTRNLFISPDGNHLSIRNRDRLDKRGHPVGGDLGVVQYDFSRHTNLLPRFPSTCKERTEASFRPLFFTCELRQQREWRIRGTSWL